MKNAVARLAAVLANASKPLNITSKRNIELLTKAVDAGVCKFTREVTRHSVIDPAWKVKFGVELTNDGKRIAVA
ncbi:hypothetical protein A3C20_03095 [Candidatus Kaiserbacteria bacterium RIFCSPHIGHO2_02_FULL_55_25]|uniref:Uncharacterized protein n=1 Tax=Candidatus Kaiserbacteria bacterium RIFCSPHIGHO2_02_FULL_55_25 TaxID=1798498 RepID=A0A1F6E6J8_9BACT|nr:MAG: hypothetical protein A2764_02835 [Candidatus Kaiserbacteria bacterium RIFCSPHIGHO2_01_FULL_55_79]OGG69251.1 MAG: hypothetical protein A3C20_03095 [Candidatus Kaiserbacteria bacterium RIFCSPHIGHO2_02_FULL_55_25]OGG83885.1 MAG: hypothetical protein A3A42_00100 [Candidatus Kaiserbacteria bacterium RIFCSPLOWO2_01_FULL_55_25]